MPSVITKRVANGSYMRPEQLGIKPQPSDWKWCTLTTRPSHHRKYAQRIVPSWFLTLTSTVKQTHRGCGVSLVTCTWLFLLQSSAMTIHLQFPILRRNWKPIVWNWPLTCSRCLYEFPSHLLFCSLAVLDPRVGHTVDVLFYGRPME